METISVQMDTILIGPNTGTEKFDVQNTEICDVAHTYEIGFRTCDRKIPDRQISDPVEPERNTAVGIFFIKSIFNTIIKFYKFF